MVAQTRKLASVLLHNISSQHFIYGTFVLLINILLIFNSFWSPCGITSLILVSMVYYRDTFFLSVRLLHYIFSRDNTVHQGESKEMKPCNVLCVVPTYKEDEVGSNLKIFFEVRNENIFTPIIFFYSPTIIFSIIIKKIDTPVGTLPFKRLVECIMNSFKFLPNCHLSHHKQFRL